MPAAAINKLEPLPEPHIAALISNCLGWKCTTCRSRRRWVLLGSGSNSLFPDPVFNGTVIINRMKHCRVVDGSTCTDGTASSVFGNEHGRPGHTVPNSRATKRHAVSTLSVGSGYHLAQLAMSTTSKGWAGLEEFCGIPGTVGGALMCNAGSHGRVGPLSTPYLHTVGTNNWRRMRWTEGPRTSYW